MFIHISMCKHIHGHLLMAIDSELIGPVTSQWVNLTRPPRFTFFFQLHILAMLTLSLMQVLSEPM